MNVEEQARQIVEGLGLSEVERFALAKNVENYWTERLRRTERAEKVLNKYILNEVVAAYIAAREALRRFGQVLPIRDFSKDRLDDTQGAFSAHGWKHIFESNLYIDAHRGPIDHRNVEGDLVELDEARLVLSYITRKGIDSTDLSDEVAVMTESFSKHLDYFVKARDFVVGSLILFRDVPPELEPTTTLYLKVGEVLAEEKKK